MKDLGYTQYTFNYKSSKNN